MSSTADTMMKQGDSGQSQSSVVREDGSKGGLNSLTQAAGTASLLTHYNLMNHTTMAVGNHMHHPFVRTNTGPFLQPPHLAVVPGLNGRPDPTFMGATNVPALHAGGPAAAVQFIPAAINTAPSTDGKEASDYKDYSRLPAESGESASLSGSNSASSGKDPSFPVKLHRILSIADHEEFITWLPHGRSWRVLKPKAFEAKVIPLYFRHAKYASFMRQVNGWGFKRITQGPDHNSYYHELFLRGLPHLCDKMQRPPKIKGGASAPADSNVTHPDFYHLSMVAPLPPAKPQGQQSAYVTSIATSETATGGSKEVSPNASESASACGAVSDDSTSRKDARKTTHKPEERKVSESENLSDKNFSISSSAYAGGSEGDGDSDSDPSSASSELSGGKGPGGKSQGNSPAGKQSDESQSSKAAANQSKSSHQGNHGVNIKDTRQNTKPQHEDESSIQQRATNESNSGNVIFPTMMANGCSTQFPMMQFGGSNAPYLMFQQPGVGGGPPTLVVHQPNPQQPQYLRVVNQNGGEVGYIQMPQNQGMNGQMMQHLAAMVPSGPTTGFMHTGQMIQGMPGAGFMPASPFHHGGILQSMQSQAPQMQAVTSQQMQAVTSQQLQAVTSQQLQVMQQHQSQQLMNLQIMGRSPQMMQFQPALTPTRNNGENS